ncbi:MAG: hypothetical protein Kow0075_00830 [Salibacteraceae bacterium]
MAKRTQTATDKLNFMKLPLNERLIGLVKGLVLVVLFNPLAVEATTNQSTPENDPNRYSYIPGCMPGSPKLFGKNIVVFNLGPEINSPYSEYNPVLNEAETFMLISSRRDSTTGQKQYEDGKYYEDILISRKVNGKWGPVRNLSESMPPFPYSMNSDKHEAPVAMSYSEDMLIIFRENKLWYSKKTEGGYGPPQEFPKQINFAGYQRHASLTGDGKTMYFSAEVLDKPTGRINLDIFRSVLDENGSWSTPERLPFPVNTPYDEDSPEITKDGKAMYFSSTRVGGYGGYDVYKTSLKGDQWSTPQNLCEPINSGADDIYFKITRDSSTAYFSSNRLGGYGAMDIYKVLLDVPTFNSCTDYASQSDLIITGNDTIQAGAYAIFDGSRSKLNGATPANWYWKVGNNKTKNSPLFEHRFESPGTYTLYLEVSDIDRDKMVARYACVQKPVHVVTPDEYRAYRNRNTPVKIIETSGTVVIDSPKNPSTAGGLVAKNIVETTFENTPLEIYALALQPNDLNDKKAKLLSVGKPMDGIARISEYESGVIQYYPRKGFTGVDVFSYTIEDSNASQAEGWIAIKVIELETVFENQILRPDEKETTGDSSIVLNVYENDATGIHTDKKIVAISKPQNGNASILDSAGGKISYTPIRGFIGSDAFSYAVAEKNDNSAPRTASFVRVKVQSPDSIKPYIITRPDFKIIDRGERITLNVLLNDSLNPAFQWKISALSKPAGGLVQILDSRKGQILYLPNSDFTGMDAFTYVIEANNGFAASEGVTIIVRSEEPLLAFAEDTYNKAAAGESDEPAGHLDGAGEEIASNIDEGKGSATNKQGGKLIDLVRLDPASIDTTNKPDIDLKPIHFGFDSYAIRPTARAILDKNLQQLLQHPDAVVQIISHTDAWGDSAYNQWLSEQRAMATKKYLIEHGVDEKRIAAAIGVGEKFPINGCAEACPVPKLSIKKTAGQRLS